MDLPLSLTGELHPRGSMVQRRARVWQGREGHARVQLHERPSEPSRLEGLGSV